MGKKKPGQELGVLGEISGVRLGDTRLDARAGLLVERIAAAPSLSFPKLFPDTSELEAFYRFTGNDAVEWRDILEPHVAATVARCLGQKVVRVAHDTTSFVFSGKRDGLGTVMGQTKGFFLHASVAVAGDDHRMCLGTLGLMPFVRTPKRGSKSINEWKLEVRRRPRAEKESSRWEGLALETTARLPSGVRVIHVMDQEADDYVLLDALAEAQISFVVRGSSQRQVRGNHSPTLQTELDTMEGEAFRSIIISSRNAKQAKRGRNLKSHPIREERLAELRIRWGDLRLQRPQHAQTSSPDLRMALVQVFEPNPPEGEVPIVWTLFTSETVRTPDEAMAVVDHYRARWVVEEYFKALKTGCGLEERQLTSYDGLLRVLALLCPIAWQLLMLRSLGRLPDSPPASIIFSGARLLLLNALLTDRIRKPLQKNPTVRDVMLGIARLGGHLPRNGDPGWIVLGRGFQDFLSAEGVWRALRAAREM